MLGYQRLRRSTIETQFQFYTHKDDDDVLDISLDVHGLSDDDHAILPEVNVPPLLLYRQAMMTHRSSCCTIVQLKILK